ncbi:DUF2786 domain-containing protein [Teichococcus aerofrigidensis]
MSQSDELAKVKERIRLLTERTVSNGCTEAEALQAAEMVGRLLDRYALSMSEIEVRQSVCVQRSVPLMGQQRRPIDACVPAVARFCDCKVWLAREGEHAEYVFFGFEEDVSLAIYLLAVVERGMRHELEAFRALRPQLRGPDLRVASRRHQQGMAVRVGERLEAMHRERGRQRHREAPAGAALMVVKQATVEEAFRETRIRLTRTRPSAVRLDAAYRQGYDAGGRINLNRPLRGQGRERLP